MWVLEEEQCWNWKQNQNQKEIGKQSKKGMENWEKNREADRSEDKKKAMGADRKKREKVIQSRVEAIGLLRRKKNPFSFCL